MKKIVLMLALAMQFSVLFAQSAQDTSSNNANAAANQSALKPTANNNTPKDASNQKPATCCSNNWFGKCITVLPVFLYLIITSTLLGLLNKGGYKISDALKEKDPIQKATIKGGEMSGATPPAGTPQPNSASRLIAFLTGMTTLTLLSCITTYWLYKSLVCCQEIDLSHLTTIFVTLGLGIVPYGFNKISSAFKPNN